MTAESEFQPPFTLKGKRYKEPTEAQFDTLAEAMTEATAWAHHESFTHISYAWPEQIVDATGRVVYEGDDLRERVA